MSEAWVRVDRGKHRPTEGLELALGSLCGVDTDVRSQQGVFYYVGEWDRPDTEVLHHKETGGFVRSFLRGVSQC